MPTYEYECTKCGLVFEEFKSMSAPKRQRCPKCRSKVNRLISGGTAVVFKGSGFYVNDAGRGGSGSSNGETKESLPSAEETVASQKREVASSESSGGKSTSGTKAKSDK